MTEVRQAVAAEGTTICGPSRRLVLFGDQVGLPQLMAVVAPGSVVALVGAAIRPEQHAALEALGADADVPVLIQPKRDAVARPGFVQQLESLAPDLFLVNSYSMILAPDLLSIPKNGAVNVHGALLPAYRGANPTEWALINGERETGVTIHAIDSGIDTGAVLAQRHVPIAFEDTWIDVRRRIGAATEGLLQEVVPSLIKDGVRAAPQTGEARHWRRRTAEDGRFDWDMPVIAIYNLIRALVAPHPGAVTPAGVTISEWRSLPEIVWAKCEARKQGWGGPHWQLSARRPPRAASRRAANTHLDLVLSRRAGGQVGVCRITGPGRPDPAVAQIEYAARMRVSPAAAAELHRTVEQFAAAELAQPVVFA